MRRLFRLFLAFVILSSFPALALHQISQLDDVQIQALIDQARLDGKGIQGAVQAVAGEKRKNINWQTDPKVLAWQQTIHVLSQDRQRCYGRAFHLTLAAAGLMATDAGTGKLTPPEVTMTVHPFEKVKKKWLPEIGKLEDVTKMRGDSEEIVDHEAPGLFDVARTSPDGVTTFDMDALDRMEDGPHPKGWPPVKVTASLMALVLYHESRHFEMFTRTERTMSDRYVPDLQDKEIWSSTDQGNALNVLYPGNSTDKANLGTITALQVKNYEALVKEEQERNWLRSRLRLPPAAKDAAHFGAPRTAAELSELERAFNTAEADICRFPRSLPRRLPNYLNGNS